MVAFKRSPMLKNIDAVILCGGLGKRLRSVIGASQKTMADFNGHPFLMFVLNHLKNQGIRRLIFCTGFKARDIENYFKRNNLGLKIEFSREKKPLGTGGALKLAKSLIQSDHFFVLNGDSFCPLSLNALSRYHMKRKALATLAVLKVNDIRDFGAVVLDRKGKITHFIEKGKVKRKLTVNAGVYCLSQKIFSLMPRRMKFSLEYDCFPDLMNKNFFGFKVRQKFFDIGTPERFKYAQTVFKNRT